jgi:MFS family permease
MSSKSDSTNVAARPTPKRIPFFRQLIDHASITPEVEAWDYAGSGTDADPYVVTWIENDPRNPMLYPALWKWGMTLLVGFVTLAVSFVSAAYTGGGPAIIAEFNCSEVEFVLGLSLFVLGFAIGPLLWAPLSELYGRQILFSTTYLGLTIFNAGAAGAQNIATLVVLRFLAGAVGSAPLTNAGGVLADMFNAKQRGMAMCVWAAAPFMGPVIGPIVGGFVGETIGELFRA